MPYPRGGLMILFVTAFLTLLATNVLARPHLTLTPTISTRQTADPPSKDCNATCDPFTAVKEACNVPHCGCNVTYLQAQGECLLCQTDTPKDAASVQIFLDAEQNQCHEEGIPITFKLSLPPDAQAIFDETDRQSATLRRQQTAFLALQIAGGHVGLFLVLAFAIFSRRVHRDPTFLNFCITWILSSVFFSTLLYRGTNGNTIVNSLGRVSPGECLGQAAFINGAPILTACSTMALIIQLWIRLRTTIYCDILNGPRQKQWVTFMLLAMPYVLFLAFAIPSVFIGKMKITIQGTSLQQTRPSNFYCSIIASTSFLRIGYGVTLGLLIITTIFDALIVSILYKHWLAFRKMQAKGVVSLSILIRVMIFSIYRVVVAITYGTILNKPRTLSFLLSDAGDALSVGFNVPLWVDMLQATIPIVAFLVLGINTDMLSGLMFWKRNSMI